MFAKEEESLETVFGDAKKEFEEFKKIDDELKSIIDDAKCLINESGGIINSADAAVNDITVLEKEIKSFEDDVKQAEDEFKLIVDESKQMLEEGIVIKNEIHQAIQELELAAVGIVASIDKVVENVVDRVEQELKLIKDEILSEISEKPVKEEAKLPEEPQIEVKIEEPVVDLAQQQEQEKYLPDIPSYAQYLIVGGGTAVIK